jgi:hypothetical protein
MGCKERIQIEGVCEKSAEANSVFGSKKQEENVEKCIMKNFRNCDVHQTSLGYSNKR